MFCDLYACIKLFISNNLRIYDVRRYYRFESRTHRQLIGTLTEWLGSGLQNRVQQFESAGYLKASIVSMFAFFICIVYFCFVLYGFKKLQGELIKLSL